MMTQPHHQYEEWARYITEDLPLADCEQLRSHVYACPPCAADLSDVCCELALLGVVVEQRSVSLGARARFMQRVKDSNAGVSSSRVSASKKSLLNMQSHPAKQGGKNIVAATGKVDTDVRVANRVIAARIAGIF